MKVMKTLLFVLLFVCSLANAQLVQIFDKHDNLLNVEPVEYLEVPDLLDHHPTGRYLLIEVVAYYREEPVKGYYFKRCWYDKQTKIIEKI